MKSFGFIILLLASMGATASTHGKGSEGKTSHGSDAKTNAPVAHGSGAPSTVLKGCPFLLNPAAFDLKNSAVHRHAAAFATAGKDGSLTEESMTEGHTVQGITSGVGVKVRAITNLLADKKLPETAEAVSTIENPASTGIWDAKGNFDEKVFQEVATLAISVPGVEEKVLTEAIILDYLKKKHGTKDLGTATWIYKVIPVSWKAVTEGSIHELITYFGNAKTETGEKAITVSRMRQFYEDTNTLVMQRIASH